MDAPTSSQRAPRSEAFGGLPPSFRIPPQPKPWPTWLRVLLPLLIFVIGGGIAAALVFTKPSAEKKAKPQAALPVEVEPVQVGEHAVVVRAQGTVRPAQQVVLQPEITGRIIWLADDLVLGGRLEKGQPLVRIDGRDYQLAVRQQQAQVGNQALALRVEKARQGVAQEEWELYQRERQERDQGRRRQAQSRARDDDAHAAADAGPPSPDDVLDQGKLALREPQVKSAQIALQSARSSLARAQLQLSRTALTAPFNALVQAEAVEVGQLVGPASQLATLVGTDAYWVQVSLPLDQLSHIDLPADGRVGASARISLRAGGHRIERRGRIVRLLGDLDPVGRMARVLVEIDDPLGLERQGRPGASSATPVEPAAEVAPGGDPAGNGHESLPLLLGSFVHVEIYGKTLDDVAEIPTRALQSDDRVFVLGEDEKLQIRRVEVLLRSVETTVVRGDLSDGERVVVSPISAPVEGMALRVLSPDDAPAASAEPSATPPGSSAAAPVPSNSAEPGGKP